MLQFHIIENGLLQPVLRAQVTDNLAQLAWVDLINPTEDEEQFVEHLLNTDIPTRNEMHEIELSNRLYQRNGCVYATATLITNTNSKEPESHAVMFILVQKILVTVRYSNPVAFENFISAMNHHDATAYQGRTLLIGLLEAVVDSAADILEMIGHHLDDTTHALFLPKRQLKAFRTKHKQNFEAILQQIGVDGDYISKANESLVSLTRLLSYVQQTDYFHPNTEEYKRIDIQLHDIPALRDHAMFLSNKVNFLLDATLGLISIEQNTIIKIVSVAAVVFLPPTLIASIYGMNFHVIPELSWPHGYLYALTLMTLSSFLPYKIFKRKGWM